MVVDAPSLTNLSGLLDVESVSDESKIWVEEPHDFTDLLLNLVSWVEDDLDPSVWIKRKDYETIFA